MTKIENRINSLDLLRVIAALMVCIYHFFYRGYAYGTGIFVDLFFVKYGYLGVSLFFMISGFVISQSAAHTTSIRFVIGRFSRLYPTLFIGGFLTYFIVLAIDSVDQASYHSLFCNITMALPVCDILNIKYIDSSYWSLSVEIIFYALISMVIAFRKKADRFDMRYIQISWLIMSMISVVFTSKLIGYSVFFLDLKYAPLFVAGMVFYDVYKCGFFGRCDLIILSVTYFMNLYYLIDDIHHLSKINSSASYSKLSIVLILSSFYMVFCAIVLRRFVLKTKIFAVAGAATYAFYVLHQMIGYSIINLMVNKYDWAGFSAAFFAFIVIVCIAYCVLRISTPLEKLMKNKMNKIANKGSILK